MLNYFTSSLVYLAEMVIAYVFFSGIGYLRKNKLFAVAIGVILFETEAIINVLGKNTVWLNGIIMFLVNFVFAVLCFCIQMQTAIVYTLLLIALSGAIEFVVIFIISAFSGANTTDYNYDLSLLIIIAVLSKALYFLICIALLKIIKRKDATYRFPGIYYIFAGGTIIGIIVFWYIGSHSGITQTYKYLLAGVSGLLFLFLVFIFVTYHRSIQHEMEYVQIKNANEKLVLEKAYYKLLESQNENLQMCIHDAKKHLDTIKDLSINTETQNYVDRLKSEYDKYSKGCQSGNRLLDVIIDKYDKECAKKGIAFSYDVRTCNLGNISELHLVSILGNLLDNAVESAENSYNKYISLETFLRDNFEIINIINSCDNPPKTKASVLLTTKKNVHIHGYGIKIVLRTLEQYNGDIDWLYDEPNHRFITTVMITM